jgi:hypothetical protein
MIYHLLFCSGYVRFGRAALAVGHIGLDYRKSLFKTKYEEPAQYEAAKKEQSRFFSFNHPLFSLHCTGHCFGSGSTWFRNQLIAWVWIRIRIRNEDPDSDRGLTRAKKKKKTQIKDR